MVNVVFLAKGNSAVDTFAMLGAIKSPDVRHGMGTMRGPTQRVSVPPSALIIFFVLLIISTIVRLQLFRIGLSPFPFRLWLAAVAMQSLIGIAMFAVLG